MNNDNRVDSAARPQVPDRKVARINAEAEQRRINEQARIEADARRHDLALQQQRDKLALKRERRLAKAAARRERQAVRQQRRAKLTAKVRRAVPTLGRRVMIAGPILAPMAVAWIGQIQFAQGTLSWPFLGAIVFAASWELTTAFAGWMYHTARQAGDHGTLFRAATWLFAASAGAMNYWHALDGHAVTDPTPKAVSYGAMSLVGIGLWELYSSLVHRKALRERGIIPLARPRFGVARWLRYPRITWWAWSLTIRRGLTTTEQAWAAGVAEVERRSRARAVRGSWWARWKARRSGRAPIRVTAVWSRGPKVARQNGLTAWTALPVVWLPTLEQGAESTTRTTERQVVQTTGETTAPRVDRTTQRTTPGTTQRTTPGTTQRTTVRTTGKNQPKKRRRSREQLRAELEEKVQELVVEGGEIQVKPLAKALRANRTTVRELLDEMGIRPMVRKEAAG